MAAKEESIEEIHSSVQRFLMKKEQEYGCLRFLLSRATTETSRNIDQLVQGIVDIFNMYKVFLTNQRTTFKMTDEEKSQPKVYTSYRLLLLNTSFNIQQRLAEDTLHGHLVESWPALSPYLFIQVVWNLHCEELLLETILYAPLELCLELIEIINTSVIELEFERALHFVTQLIAYTYRRFLMLKNIGVQSNNLTEHTEQLVAAFEMLLGLLTNQKLTRTSDLPQQIRYQRHGIILKRVLRLTKMCTEERLIGGTMNTLQKFYSLSLGNKNYCNVSSESLKSMITVIDQELVTLLMNMIKSVDCHMYIAWAEVDDRDNILLTLQRAIAIECYYFIQYIKNDAFLQQNEEFRKCLKQLAGSNEDEPTLTLDELRNAVENGRLEAIKELLKRYREWDDSMLLFVEKWCTLLDKDDCQLLFDYLKYTFSARQYHDIEKRKNQDLVTRILLKRVLPELYDITITYLLRHYENNFMEQCYDSFSFHGLLNRSAGKWNSAYFLKHLLIHLLHNPKRVMTVLMRVALGSDTYERLLSLPQDMLVLRPFLSMKRDNDCTYLTYLMREVCMADDNWNARKFTHFVYTMLDAKVTSPDDFVNNVFIPYLAEKPFAEHNVNCLLINICKIIDSYTQNIDMIALCTTLVRKMTAWRKCNVNMLRSVMNETQLNIMRVLSKCICKQNLMTLAEKRSVVNAVIAHIEPLDKANVAPLLHMMHGNLLDIIIDYERRCFAIRKRFKLDRRGINFMYEHVDKLRLEKKDFIRHMFLHANEVEYQRYCCELTLIFWQYIGWKSEIDALDNMLCITMEAIRVTLEYPFEMPPDSFIFLMKNSMLFYRTFERLERVNDHKETMVQILLKNIAILSESMRWTQYSELYTSLLEGLRAITDNVTHIYHYYKEIMDLIETFVSEATELVHVPGEANNVSFSPNEDVLDLSESYRFIRACLSVPGIERHHRCTEKIEKLVFSDDYNTVNYVTLN